MDEENMDEEKIAPLVMPVTLVRKKQISLDLGIDDLLRIAVLDETIVHKFNLDAENIDEQLSIEFPCELSIQAKGDLLGTMREMILVLLEDVTL